MTNIIVVDKIREPEMRAKISLKIFFFLKIKCNKGSYLFTIYLELPRECGKRALR